MKPGTKLKLLYTLVLIFCMSAFASSKNECTYPAQDSNSCGKGSSPVKAVKEFSKEISEERPEFSTFQFVKFLYI